MARKREFWPIRFVITTLNPAGEELVTWTLDQAVSDRYNEKLWTGLENQVNRHLSDLSKRTGCEYRIDTWGYRETVDANLWRYNVTPV